MNSSHLNFRKICVRNQYYFFYFSYFNKRSEVAFWNTLKQFLSMVKVRFLSRKLASFHRLHHRYKMKPFHQQPQPYDFFHDRCGFLVDFTNVLMAGVLQIFLLTRKLHPGYSIGIALRNIFVPFNVRTLPSWSKGIAQRASEQLLLKESSNEAVRNPQSQRIRCLHYFSRQNARRRRG